MSRGSGKEMRQLMVAVTASTLLLVLAVIAYFMVDVVVTTNRNMRKNEEMVVLQSVQTMAQIGENVHELASDPELLNLLNQEFITELMKGNWEPLYDFILKFTLSFYPIDYIAIIKDGELVAYEFSRDLKKGLEIDISELPLTPHEKEYQELYRLGNKEGYFISRFFDIDLRMMGVEEFRVSMIVDCTQELEEAREYFRAQRNRLVARLSVVSAIAVILSLLLTTLGLRYFTRKYVVRPIEELNRAAEEIVEGTFKGEVTVDPDSAYSALQGLLRSGQKVLSRMEKELE